MNASKPKLITQPTDWWVAFENAARESKKTLAEWLGDAGKARLPKEVSDSLSERPGAHRPKAKTE